MSTPAPLEKNIEAYEAMRETLEAHHLHKFVVFHDAEFIDSFDRLDNASSEAVHRFGQGPFAAPGPCPSDPRSREYADRKGSPAPPRAQTERTRPQSGRSRG